MNGTSPYSRNAVAPVPDSADADAAGRSGIVQDRVRLCTASHAAVLPCVREGRGYSRFIGDVHVPGPPPWAPTCASARSAVLNP
jgi:hypothetical protein